MKSMGPLSLRLPDPLQQHQRLSTATGVIAGLIGAVSVLFTEVTSHFKPHGWHRAAVVLHLNGPVA